MTHKIVTERYRKGKDIMISYDQITEQAADACKFLDKLDDVTQKAIYIAINMFLAQKQTQDQKTIEEFLKKS